MPVDVYASANPSASSSSNNAAASSTTASRRTTSSSKAAGGSNNPQKSGKSSASASSASSSSKWKLVRPWQPPSGSLRSAEATLEDGNGELQQNNDDSDDEREERQNNNEEDDNEPEQEAEATASNALLASSGRLKRMHLEVVDVSSTSVSLSIFGEPTQQESNHQHLDTSLGSTSSMTNQTTATRRSRAASTSSERVASNPPQPPNISIKLNSAAWPHVFHTDASFFDAENSRQPNDDQGLSSSSILVWGLSPGQNYHIELGVFEEGIDDEDETAEAEDLSEISDTDENIRAAASIRTLDATEPDVPPPPYSSHDPSSGAPTHNDAEAALRTMLEKLRITAKQKESALQSSISSMRRANDKLTREDQRHRQRIHMLEDSTSRLREVAADEDAEHETVLEQIEELEETEKLTVTRLERRRSQLEDSEKQTREEAEKEEAELAELKDRLEKAAEREEEVLAKKLKLERELLPTYNIQLATLEADLRRLVDDHRRRFPYQHHLPPQAFNNHLAHSGGGGGGGGGNPVGNVGGGSGHVHAAHNNISNIRSGRMQARAVQYQQAQLQQQQQHQQPHNHLPQTNAPGLLRPSESSGTLLQQGGAEGNHLDAASERIHRPGSSVGNDEQRTERDGPASVDGIAGLGRVRSQTGDRQAGSAAPRQGSRFAWSSPNSWASKVAGGVRSSHSGPAGEKET